MAGKKALAQLEQGNIRVLRYGNDYALQNIFGCHHFSDGLCRPEKPLHSRFGLSCT
jgi:hypothetical protein